MPLIDFFKIVSFSSQKIWRNAFKFTLSQLAFCFQGKSFTSSRSVALLAFWQTQIFVLKSKSKIFWQNKKQDSKWKGFLFNLNLLGDDQEIEFQEIETFILMRSKLFAKFFMKSKLLFCKIVQEIKKTPGALGG